MKTILLLAALLCLAGCATAPAAWERGNLARAEMAWEPDALLAEQREQTYSSKEQAAGGASTGGGGCGCSN